MLVAVILVLPVVVDVGVVVPKLPGLPEPGEVLVFELLVPPDDVVDASVVGPGAWVELHALNAERLAISVQLLAPTRLEFAMTSNAPSHPLRISRSVETASIQGDW
jgi:hypothetical protein